MGYLFSDYNYCQKIINLLFEHTFLFGYAHYILSNYEERNSILYFTHHLRFFFNQIIHIYFRLSNIKRVWKRIHLGEFIVTFLRINRCLFFKEKMRIPVYKKRGFSLKNIIFHAIKEILEIY